MGRPKMEGETELGAAEGKALEGICCQREREEEMRRDGGLKHNERMQESQIQDDEPSIMALTRDEGGQKKCWADGPACSIGSPGLRSLGFSSGQKNRGRVLRQVYRRQANHSALIAY